MQNASDTHRKNPVSAWQLIKPYWVSEEWGKAWTLLIAIVAMNMGMVYLSKRLNDWRTSFYNTLADKNLHAFPKVMLTFTVIALCLIGIGTVRVSIQQKLEFDWRQWITHRYMTRWLGQANYYRIERDSLIDNPDQRISDDLQTLASSTLSLSLDLISNVATLITFSVVLWSLASALTFHISGHELTLPGYMVWAAVIYALIGSWIMQKTNKPLVAINYQRQQAEANFRFGLIRLRENAEQIGFYGGESTEQRSLEGRFGKIRENWTRVIKFTRRFNVVYYTYDNIATIIPIIVAAPRYFAGAYTIGTLFTISGAFGNVSDSLSWFIYNYDSLSNWRATVNRLREFHAEIHPDPSIPPEASGSLIGKISRQLTPGNRLTVRDLSLSYPNGQPLTDIGTLEIDPGTHWLIEGPTGAGKSTLLRALAGLWQFGSGTIAVPEAARAMFVPQRSYLPIGTLREAICYPSAVGTIDDAAIRSVLGDVELADYQPRLDESAHWERKLSQGEQQKLAFARVLLHRPDYVFLDEATSALDPASERRLYELLVARLPRAAIVSVGHRIALREFHAHRIDLAPQSGDAAAMQLATAG
jgi:putative ATP-binding cassette transporter